MLPSSGPSTGPCQPGRRTRRRFPAWWLCGSGTHPCGSVSGAPGHNAAQAILIVSAIISALA